MNREIEFCEDEYCDDCGAKGAYDFMGDYLCPECLRKHRHDRIRKIDNEQKQKKTEKQRN